MERNWEMNITGNWFNQQGYMLLIESSDNNTFTGDFCFKAGKLDKKIPVNGVIMPNENGHWPLVFMINWGNYFKGVDAFTCFQIDWNKNHKGMAFDMQWTKILNWPSGQDVVNGILHFCQFDFKDAAHFGEVRHPHPFHVDASPIAAVSKN